MHSIHKFILGLGVCSLFHSPIFAADLTAGEQKSNACFGCHGQGGNSGNPLVPSWPDNRLPI